MFARDKYGFCHLSGYFENRMSGLTGLQNFGTAIYLEIVFLLLKNMFSLPPNFFLKIHYNKQPQISMPQLWGSFFVLFKTNLLHA